MRVEDQIRLFAEAAVVVAAHGAALTNVAFCSPGAVVVELFAPDYVNTCYWALTAEVDGVEYRYAVGEGRNPRPGTPLHGVWSDIVAPIGAVLRILDAIDA